MATAHYNYAQQISPAIEQYIRPEIREHLANNVLAHPVGEIAIMHTHNTLPAMAQRYHLPMWKVPFSQHLDDSDRGTILGNRAIYEATKTKYIEFANDLLLRMNSIN